VGHDLVGTHLPGPLQTQYDGTVLRLVVSRPAYVLEELLAVDDRSDSGGPRVAARGAVAPDIHPHPGNVVLAEGNSCPGKT